MNPFLLAQKGVSALMNDSETALNNLLRDRELFDGEVLSTIHHDFRNDLNVLTNYSELLDSNGSDGEVVHVISKKLAGSMNALMVSLRLESGALEPSPEELAPVELAEERIDWFQPLYEYVEREFTVSVEDPPGTVRTDRQYLQLILDSLLLLGSQEPEGKTEMIFSGTTQNSPDQYRIILRQDNPPWRIERTPELENTLHNESLEELVSKFSARTGLFLHTIRRLLETLGGDLEIPQVRDGSVLLRAMICFQKQEPD